MNYFNRELETLPIDQLRKLQSERLIQQVNKLYARVPYYRALFDEAGVRPSDIRSITDIHKIPFTYKDALRKEYPFGLFAEPMDQVIRLHASSGTTGKPIVVGYTRNDIEIFSEVVARSLAAAGCSPGEKLQNAYGYGLFTGGLGLHYGAEKLGLTVIPISGGGTEKQLMLLKDFQTENICCTPSYALTLAEGMKKQGMSLADFNLKRAVLGAEPWTESVRKEVEELLGVSATNIYGLSEIIGPGVSQEDFEEKGTGSYIWEDHFYPEIVDRITGEPLPEGETGVLVFTTLTKEAMPMLRYWTNDITSLSYEHSKKRTHIKMGQILGRADGMLIIRGVNLFHTQVEALLQDFSRLSANYQLVVTKNGNTDAVEVKVELHPEFYQSLIRESVDLQSSEIFKREVSMLSKKIKDVIGLSMLVTLCEPNTIPKSEGGKLNRVIDLRN